MGYIVQDIVDTARFINEAVERYKRIQNGTHYGSDLREHEHLVEVLESNEHRWNAGCFQLFETFAMALEPDPYVEHVHGMCGFWGDEYESDYDIIERS